jgi:predicted porin
MRTEIDAQWATDGIPSAADQTGVTTKHAISESINWNPLARLYLQTEFSYVLNQTETPASSINLNPNTSPTVVDFRNDYWMVTAGGGYIIDDKTDLHAQYTFYRANDYFKNSGVAVPYGMGATEHTASATLTRQLTKQVRLLLSYTYFDYSDETSGGHDNYRAHSIFSSLQFRF